MQIEIKIDSACAEPKVLIMTDRMTEEVNALIRKLSEEKPRMLIGFADGSARMLDPQNLLIADSSAIDSCCRSKSSAAVVSMMFPDRLCRYKSLCGV